MKNSTEQATHSAFLRAAELQHRSMTDDHPDFRFEKGRNCGDGFSYYACDNIGYAVGDGCYEKNTPEQRFFKEYFEQDDTIIFCWWPELENGNWDHESRILALLLCAEMLRQ